MWKLNDYFALFAESKIAFPLSANKRVSQELGTMKQASLPSSKDLLERLTTAKVTEGQCRCQACILDARRRQPVEPLSKQGLESIAKQP